MWGPFVSASSSRLTLARPAFRASLAGTPRDLRLGSGLTANRINLPYASELYPAFNFSSCSPRPARCYRPLLAFPQSSCDVAGDSARAPDAAPTGQTLEAVKERVCFYSFYFCSQRKRERRMFLRFNRVQPVHRGVQQELCSP